MNDSTTNSTPVNDSPLPQPSRDGRCTHHTRNGRCRMPLPEFSDTLCSDHIRRRHKMVRRFLLSGRTGFYIAVLREGEVGAGDEIKRIARDANAIPVSEITRLYVAKRYGDTEISSARRALRVAALPESWNEYFRERLRHASSG
jgi:hypothetical protein